MMRLLGRGARRGAAECGVVLVRALVIRIKAGTGGGMGRELNRNYLMRVVVLKRGLHGYK